MVKHIGIFCKGVEHNCFNPLQQPSHCSPDLYNNKKRFYKAKFQNLYDNFSESSYCKIRSGSTTVSHKKVIDKKK